MIKRRKMDSIALALQAYFPQDDILVDGVQNDSEVGNFIEVFSTHTLPNGDQYHFRFDIDENGNTSEGAYAEGGGSVGGPVPLDIEARLRAPIDAAKPFINRLLALVS